MLRVRLLGGLGLELDGRPVRPPEGRPVRFLLAWLALHPGMHARSRIAGALWPDVLEESARNSLRTALAELKRALGERAGEVLLSTRDRVGLAPQPATWVDVLTFQQLVATGRLEEALELCAVEGEQAGAGRWRELLPDLDADWVHAARAEHAERLAAVLGRLADMAEAAGDLRLAVQRSRERVALEPLSEEAHRALMRRLDALGDRAAALATYERLRERLRADLHMAPSPETRAFADRVRRAGERPLSAEAQPPLPPQLAREQQSPFVGRGGALALLQAAWKLTRDGQPQLLFVSGEPGIGKTRLVGEFARSVHASGAMVLLGRAYEQPLVAYQPFVEAIAPLLTSLGPEAGELARLVPGEAAVGEQLPSPLSDPEGARFRLFEALASALAATSREPPVLLVLEDLHWADDPTVLLLGHLARASYRARLLVVATYRATDLLRGHSLSRLLADLRRERLGERVALQGLAVEEVETLVRSWIGTDAPPPFTEAIHRETDGNPFFVEELLRHVREMGIVSPEDAHAIGRVGVPEGVKEVIARRLSGLSGEANRVLNWAAILGREFEIGLLEDILGDADGEAVLTALDEALAAGLLREEPGPAIRYGFSHTLVRESIYEGLTAARRAHHHGRVAEALERRYGNRPERFGELARHLVQAADVEQLDRAVEYAARAAEQALAQLAYEEAVAHLERALQALELAGRPQEGRRCELLLALGDARTRSAQANEGRRAFAAAAAAARDLQRPDLLARAALGFGGVGVTIDSPDHDLVRLLEEALEAIGEDENALRARLLARLAVELYYAAPERREPLSAQAVAVARRTEDASALADVLASRHVALWAPDHLEERIGIADEIVALAERARDPVAELKGRNWRIVDLFELGDLPSLEQELGAYAGLADRTGLWVFRWYEPMWRATLAMLEGRLDDARELCAEALAIGRRAHDRNAEVLIRNQQSVYLPREEGRFGDVDLDFLRRSVVERPVGWAYRVGVIRVLAELGRLEDSRRELDRLAADGFEPPPKDLHWLAGLGELAVIYAVLGEESRAARAYEIYLPYARRNIINGRAIYCYGSTDHYLGVLAATCGRWSVALDHFEAAAALHRRLDARPHMCRTLCWQAEVLIARSAAGDRERAERLARDALELATTLRNDALIERSGVLVAGAHVAGARV